MTRSLTSPSNLERRAACPGSARLEEGLPDEQTAESREGADLHSFKAHPEYDRTLLSPAFRELLGRADELDQQIFATVIQAEKILDSEEYVERRESEVSWDGMVGHIDLIRTYPRRSIAIIRDAKFGHIPTERAEANLQLRGYAAMCEEDTVYVAITQPRASYNARVTLARYTHKDILAARHEIGNIIEASNYPDAPLNPGMHCRYCKARAFCPALSLAVTNSLVPMSILSPDLSKAAKLGRVEARLAQVSDEDLSRMLDAYALVQFIYEPMMDEARRRIEAGQLETWKLSKAFERRKIVDSGRAVALVSLSGKMSREDIMSCANLSLTKLEEKLGGNKEAREFTNRVLASVLETETTKPRVLKK